MTLKTMDHMDITYPVWIMGYHLLQPFPKEQSQLTNIFKPFSLTVYRPIVFLKTSQGATAHTLRKGTFRMIMFIELDSYLISDSCLCRLNDHARNLCT